MSVDDSRRIDKAYILNYMQFLRSICLELLQTSSASTMNLSICVFQ
ncbi:hypothetical protein KP509_36G030600 [Ceratopteris richardii]|uniref:Uncharacterized protein n=1 Tax=Ceratopteris richardii TaxID=49495 RepID=A0A8T2QD45_CERRI|nr:hypothetical protein KP509_36G030600 [Ceratopteris richardii]